MISVIESAICGKVSSIQNGFLKNKQSLSDLDIFVCTAEAVGLLIAQLIARRQIVYSTGMRNDIIACQTCTF